MTIVIPTLNEKASIASLEPTLAGRDIVVSDGGSTDGTREIARRFARVVVGPPGRAAQLNRGARAARGDVILFLHADTQLPHLNVPPGPGGCFLVRFDAPGLLLGMGDAYRNIRTRLFHDFYGDQAIFVRRDVFERLGGFRPLPFMEDYDFCRRLRATGRLRIVTQPAVTSARRYAGRALRCHLRHQWMKLRHRFARPQRRGAALAIFAKARSKTRLGPDGPRLGRAFLADLVAAHRGRRYDAIVYTDGEIDCGLPTASQIGDDLGQRLDWAVREQLAVHRKVVVVGSDLPDLEPAAVEGAIDALDYADLVLGPAEDGGYYLIAMSRPLPLFDGIEWSTPRVLAQTLERVRGLRVRLLEPRRDIDTPDDLRRRALALSRLPATSKEVSCWNFTTSESFSPSTTAGA